MVAAFSVKGAGVSVAKPTNKSANKKANPAGKRAAPKAKAKVKAKAKPAAARPAKAKGKAAAVAAKAGGGKSPSKLAIAKTPAMKPVVIKKVASPTPPKLGSGEPKGSNGKANGKAKAAPTSTIIPPPPPPTGKPSKNQAGLSSKELEFFRDMLLAKRRELVGDMRSMESEALQRSGENLSNLPLHMADMGTDNYEQEFTLGLMEKDRQLLREINQALTKIMDGRYGICEGTGKVIAKARLEVQPWAKYSIEHARKLENRGVR